MCWVYAPGRTSTAHKVTLLSNEITKSGQLHLNTDGTTKNQRKINSAAINGIIMSVAEVPDGKAETILGSLDKELCSLRKAAQLLNLPNADKFNWTLFSSSSADSASTQKRFNTLLELRKEEDLKQYGSSGPVEIELVENFCAMHLCERHL